MAREFDEKLQNLYNLFVDRWENKGLSLLEDISACAVVPLWICKEFGSGRKLVPYLALR
jgi:hypothetical protein